jgi:MipA family protein
MFLRIMLLYVLGLLGQTIYASDMSVMNQEDEKRHYYRALAGYFIDTKLTEILAGDFEVDNRRTGIIGLEYGYLLWGSIFDWPIDVTGKVGMIRHFERGWQGDFNQYTLAIKAYYSGFPWQSRLRTRLGLAQGLSYVEKIPYIEYESLVRDRQKNTSRLLNHLDLTVDVNVGDLLNWQAGKSCYFGTGIYHRSGVFGKFALFNHVDGGSNYLTVHVECLR